MVTNISVSLCSILFTVLTVWSISQNKRISIQNVLTLLSTGKALPFLHHGCNNNDNISYTDFLNIYNVNIDVVLEYETWIASVSLFWKKNQVITTFEIFKTLKVYIICFSPISLLFSIYAYGKHYFLFSQYQLPSFSTVIVFLAGCPAKDYLSQNHLQLGVQLVRCDRVPATGIWTEVTHATSTEWP